MRRVPSPNHGPRVSVAAPDMVVLHYTEMATADAAVRWLCDPASHVSSHYLIGLDGTVVAMVDEERRAWHAGVSRWDGSTDVNSRSIGIELDSPGHAPDAPEFPARQIDALLRLLDSIRRRWPVPARNVVAHSDVAPERKIDPGERFPWQCLHAAGHALWVPPAPADRAGADSAALAAALRASGYGVDGAPTPAVVDAFHRRHMPLRVGTPADGATLATALALAECTARDRREAAPR